MVGVYTRKGETLALCGTLVYPVVCLEDSIIGLVRLNGDPSLIRVGLKSLFRFESFFRARSLLQVDVPEFGGLVDEDGGASVSQGGELSGELGNETRGRRD